MLVLIPMVRNCWLDKFLSVPTASLYQLPQHMEQANPQATSGRSNCYSPVSTWSLPTGLLGPSFRVALHPSAPTLALGSLT